MSIVKTYRKVGATNNELAYKVIDRQVQAKEKDAVKEAIMNFAVAVLAEVGECAKQEDSPIYEGDKEVDSFVRLSDVENSINKYLNELLNWPLKR